MVGGHWLPREELDRRLGEVDPQTLANRKSYWSYVAADMKVDARLILLGLDSLELNEAAKSPWRLGGDLAASEMEALVDSLEASAGVPFRAGSQRVLQLLARHLGESRAALPPERQAAFDQRARAWVAAHTKQGYRVEIPRVRP
jgi:hypothetical protein